MDGFGVAAIVVMAATAARAAQVAGLAPAAEVMRSTGGVGILGMEFLWTRERAADVLARWGPEGRRAAVQSLWWDFLFIAGYAGGGYLLAWAVASHARDGRGWPGWGAFALVGAWGIVVAAVLDVVENVALLVLLQREGPPGDTGVTGVNLPLVASVAALAKWLVVAASVVAVVTVALLFHAA